MDVRVSRRPKLDSIPDDWLLRMARESLFGLDSVGHAMKLLGTVAARGNEEAAWLLDVIRRYHYFCKNKSDWLAEIMAREEGPRAQYYRGRALVQLKGTNDVHALSLLRESAESGFAAAMALLGLCLRIQLSDDEGTAWLRQAANRNDPDALHWVGDSNASRRFELWEAAAKRGHPESMWYLTEFGPQRFSPVDIVTLQARSVVISRGTIYGRESIVNQTDAPLMYIIGRELEGYDQLWDMEHKGDFSEWMDGAPFRRQYLAQKFVPCIDLFLTVSHRARVAALQTIVVLIRHYGFPRDLAVLIARRVYQTREEAVLWLQTSTRQKKDSQG